MGDRSEKTTDATHALGMIVEGHVDRPYLDVAEATEALSWLERAETAEAGVEENRRVIEHYRKTVPAMHDRVDKAEALAEQRRTRYREMAREIEALREELAGTIDALATAEQTVSSRDDEIAALKAPQW